MSDKISKSVYFNKSEDKRLLAWAQDVDMPALQINTFAGYLRALMALRFEAQEIEEDRRLANIEQKLDDLIYMLEGGIAVVDTPPRPPTLPEEITEARSLVGSLIDDEEWS